MPLSFHAAALPAALAMRCAAEQGQFWPLHEALFSTQDALSPQSLRAAALGVRVDAARYDTCVASKTVSEAVEADAAEADRIGVTGTPGFLLATKAGAHLEGTVFLGAQPIGAFASRIDALLAAHP